MTVLEIMFVKWTISGQFLRVQSHSSIKTAEISGHRWPRGESQLAARPPAEHEVNIQTAGKWLTEYYRDRNTSVLLRYELANCDRVVAHECAMCAQFKTKRFSQLPPSLHRQHNECLHFYLQGTLWNGCAQSSYVFLQKGPVQQCVRIHPNCQAAYKFVRGQGI